MGNKEKFTVEQVEKALRASGGLYMPAAQKIAVATGRTCVPNTIKNMVKRHSHLGKVCEEIREEFLDLAESGLRGLVRARHPAAIIFTLKTIGRGRGYVEGR